MASSQQLHTQAAHTQPVRARKTRYESLKTVPYLAADAAAAASLSLDTRTKKRLSIPAGTKSITASTTQKTGENLPGHERAIANPITMQAANAAQNQAL